MNYWNTGTTTTTAAGPPAGDTPEWLQDNNDHDYGMDVHGSGIGGTASTSLADEGNDVEKLDGNNNNTKRSSKRGSKGSENGPSSDTKSKVSMCSCKTIFLSVTSCLFFGVFVYSATTQDNDADGLQWMIFYALNAALVGGFIVYYACCFPLKVLYLLAASMGIWSSVYIVIAALNLKDTPKGGAEEGTGDNDNMTLYEEYAFELGGASLALFSALYHVCIAKCCVNKEGDNKSDE